MGRLKELYEEENEREAKTDVLDSTEREYPIKQRIDEYPVRHYYDGENPV